ncbi:hypothetical protein HY639_04715 [Candidatus Woesearchaeota archaeon]|nr:hypothetical protein [Candidatus Woesearchaeota archaeon]
MKLEALLAVALACQPIIPHPLPDIPLVENESSPRIILKYNNELPVVVHGLRDITIHSRTYGGSLRIELEDSDEISTYVILLNEHHLTCSNDQHPTQLPTGRVTRQYAVPMHGYLQITVSDGKGNTSWATVTIEK